MGPGGWGVEMLEAIEGHDLTGSGLTIRQEMRDLLLLQNWLGIKYVPT